MPSYRDTFPEHDLVSAVRQDLDLSREEWAELRQAATPYQRRVARLLTDPTAAPHGQPGTYANWGCRCVPCTAANSEAKRARRTDEDFKEPTAQQPGPPTDRDPLAQALYAREQGWDLTPMAQRLISEYEHDVI